MMCACTGACRVPPYRCPTGLGGAPYAPYPPIGLPMPPRDPGWFVPVHPVPPSPHGCVCPPGSEATCKGALCPRRAPSAPSAPYAGAAAAAPSLVTNPATLTQTLKP
jgi:hypothetical protein